MENLCQHVSVTLGQPKLRYSLYEFYLFIHGHSRTPLYNFHTQLLPPNTPTGMLETAGLAIKRSWVQI